MTLNIRKPFWKLIFASPTQMFKGRKSFFKVFPKKTSHEREDIICQINEKLLPL